MPNFPRKSTVLTSAALLLITVVFWGIYPDSDASKAPLRDHFSQQGLAQSGQHSQQVALATYQEPQHYPLSELQSAPPQQRQFSEEARQTEQARLAISRMTPEDLVTLKSLPPACLSEVPGLEFDPTAVNSANVQSVPVPTGLTGMAAMQSGTLPPWQPAALRQNDRNPALGSVNPQQDQPSNVSNSQGLANGFTSGYARTNQSALQPGLGQMPQAPRAQFQARTNQPVANNQDVLIQAMRQAVDEKAFENERNLSTSVGNASRIPANNGASSWVGQASATAPIGSMAPQPGQPMFTPATSYPMAASMPMGNPHSKGSSTSKPTPASKKDSGGDGASGDDSDKDPHLEIYSRTPFPSAKDCATCHEQIYDEWASSSHAYASISPMFHAFEDKINKLASGTLGYFCLRCHAPVATTMGLRRDQAIWDGPRVFREGVTCVACHRVKTPYGKVDGERRIEPGSLSDPVYGGSASDGTGVAKVGKYKEYFKVKLHEGEKGPGQLLHRRSIKFDELSESTFCMSCHQVAVKPGIKLEVVWDQYRASPACREGVSCQDCHMGIVPGRNEGYSVGPAAVVNDKVINPERKHSNHMFYGPGYSIAHPGVFPDSLEADRWTVNQWLEFDWRAGWGTEKFEDALDEGQFYTTFPEIWKEADDRFDAREIVDENLKKLEYKRDVRRQLLENGSKLDGPFFVADQPLVGQPLRFRYCLTNTNNGHNMPSGSLGAQPQVWMNTVLIGPNGSRLWESGYLDSNGDLADNHSLDVLARRIPLDTQLMNLQTKFLTTNVKGTDREMYLPINVDFDQLPYIRPDTRPTTVLNHPGFIRMEGHSIPPLGSRNVKYAVPARLMTQPGTYQLSVRMRSRAEPIYFMRFCDATPEMERMMNEWIADFHASTFAFEVR